DAHGAERRRPRPRHARLALPPPWIADSHRAINPLIDEITPPIGERQKAGDAHDAERRRPRPRHARLALPPPLDRRFAPRDRSPHRRDRSADR
ncbi:hypothetical protein, partial [Burkholderia mallei]|uniref:hypothetical protein n=1 Tax=Burkholderia mallei TaxID=13373 RepID=UPI001C49E046